MSSMSDSSKVSLSSFLVFPRQVVTWSENRHDNRNRNRIDVAGTWITDLPLPKPLVFHTHLFQPERLDDLGYFFQSPCSCQDSFCSKHINDINPFVLEHSSTNRYSL